MLLLLLFLFSIPAEAEKVKDCGKPEIPSRMIVSFPGLTKRQQDGYSFPNGTVAVFRCHEDFKIAGYNLTEEDLNAPPFKSTCNDGDWNQYYVGTRNSNYYCLNEIKNLEIENEFTGEKQLLPLKKCIDITNRTILKVKFPHVVKYFLPFVKTTPGSNYIIGLAENSTLSNDFEARNLLDMIKYIVLGRYDQFSLIIRNASLCSLQFLHPGTDDLAYCNPKLLRNPEQMRLAKIIGRRAFYECIGDDLPFGSLTQSCDGDEMYFDVYCQTTIEPLEQSAICPSNSFKRDADIHYESRCNETVKVKGDENNCSCLTGFYRHPDGRCVKFSECPAKMRQGPCADFENYITPAHSYYGARSCNCKNGLYRVGSTGKCVKPEEFPKNDKKVSSDRAHDVNCRGDLVKFDDNGGYCKIGLYRTRKGDCVKKEDCPKEETDSIGWK